LALDHAGCGALVGIGLFLFANDTLEVSGLRFRCMIGLFSSFVFHSCVLAYGSSSNLSCVR
jgi:hypothetical protein